jgi:hypothetical protein
LSEEDPAILTSVIQNFGGLFGDSDYSRDVTFRKKFGFERLEKVVNVLGLWFAVNYGKLYYSLMTYVQWTDEGTVAIMESLSLTAHQSSKDNFL